MNYTNAGTGATALGAASGTLAVTGGGEDSLLWIAMAVVLIAAGVSMLVVTIRRSRRDRALSGA